MKQREKLPSVAIQKAPTSPSPKPAAPLRAPAAQAEQAPKAGRSEALPATESPYPSFLRGLENAPDPRALQRLGVQRALQESLHRDPGMPGGEQPAGDRVVQRIIQVTPTDVDPVTGPRHSTFDGARFALVLGALAGTNFRNTLNVAPGTVRGRFNYAHLNGALGAQPDIPHLATAIIDEITTGFPGSQVALTAHAADLELALGTHAHTDAGAGDIAHFRTLSGAGGAASRFIWDYVNDQFFLSAHYNWVDGYNPFFQITGTQATY